MQNGGNPNEGARRLVEITLARAALSAAAHSDIPRFASISAVRYLDARRFVVQVLAGPSKLDPRQPP